MARIERRLKKLHEAVGPADILGRITAGAIDEGRIFGRRVAFENLFDVNVVPPMIAEVIDIEEPVHAAVYERPHTD